MHVYIIFLTVFLEIIVHRDRVHSIDCLYTVIADCLIMPIIKRNFQTILYSLVICVESRTDFTDSVQ